MKKNDSLSDERLVGLLQEEDEKAFAEIYNRYWMVLYSSAYKRVRRSDAAEEIVQDVFTRLWINRRTVFIRSSLVGYLLTAVKYQVINHLEKEFVRKNYQGSLSFSRSEFINSTEEEVHLKDLASNIESIVDALPPKCRSVFTMSRREYKTNREISEVLGISEKTVENQITRALKKIRLVIANYPMFFMLLFEIF